MFIFSIEIGSDDFSIAHAVPETEVDFLLTQKEPDQIRMSVYTSAIFVVGFFICTKV